jgi:hypothetical protein
VGFGRIVGACAGEPVWCYAWCKIKRSRLGRSKVRERNRTAVGCTSAADSNDTARYGTSPRVASPAGGCDGTFAEAALYAGRPPNASPQARPSSMRRLLRRVLSLPCLRCRRNRRYRHSSAARVRSVLLAVSRGRVSAPLRRQRPASLISGTRLCVRTRNLRDRPGTTAGHPGGSDLRRGRTMPRRCRSPSRRCFLGPSVCKGVRPCK